MDSRVQVALIEKAKLVFGREDNVFLSFPIVSPIGFQPETLSAVLAPETPADYMAAADFAQIVNFVPRDIVATPDGETFLWNIYADVLARAEHATGFDNQDDAKVAAARALLYTSDADGTRHESPAYLEYRKYRDAWIVARENYNSQLSTAQALTDPILQQQWHDELEPQLRAVIDQTKADWEALGHRAEIEAALAQITSSAANDPGSQWSDWQAAFNPDIDLVTAGATRFAPTGFSPTDITGDSNWLTATLTEEEIGMLVAAAPPGTQVSDASDVAQLDFEYRSVSVTRAWFDSGVLTSRIWRNVAGQEMLSDGGSPPMGSLPAYVTALVLVRNVRVTPKEAAQPATTGPLIFTLPPAVLTRREIDPSRIVKIQAFPPVAGGPAVDPEPQMNRAFLRLRRQSFDAAPVEHPAIPIALFRLQPRLMENAALNVAPAEPSAEATPVRPTLLRRLGMTALPPRPAIIAANPRNFDRLRLDPSLLTDAQPAPPPQPSPPQPPPPAPPDTSISILAFICRRLPKAPDPLPELTWS